MPLSFGNYTWENTKTSSLMTFLFFPPFFLCLVWAARAGDGLTLFCAVMELTNRRPFRTNQTARPKSNTQQVKAPSTTLEQVMLKTQLVFFSIVADSPLGSGVDGARGPVTEASCFGLVSLLCPGAAQSKTPYDRKVSKEAASDDQDSPGRKTQLRDKGRKDYLKLPLSPPAAAAAATGPPPTPPPPLSSPTPSPLCRTGLLALRKRQSDVPSAAGHQGLIKGGWQRRMEPNRGGSWTRADRVCAECLWLEVISCIICETLGKVCRHIALAGDIIHAL